MLPIILCEPTLENVHHFKSLIKPLKEELVIVGIAFTSEQLIQLLQSGLEDSVIIIDIRLPFTNTLNLVYNIRIKYPNHKVLAFSIMDDTKTIKEFIRFGVHGFLQKNDLEDLSLLESIKQLHKDGFLQNNNSLVSFVETFTHKPKFPSMGLLSLTEQEEAVIKMLAHDKAIKQIANELGIAASTVNAHCSRIFLKLGVTTRAGALQKAMWK